MTESELANLRAAAAAYREHDQVRTRLYEAVKAALASGMTIASVSRETNLHREHVRRIRDGKQV